MKKQPKQIAQPKNKTTAEIMAENNHCLTYPKQPKQNTSNIGKGLEWSNLLKQVQEITQCVYDDDVKYIDIERDIENRLVDFIQSLIQSTKEETLDKCLDIVLSAPRDLKDVLERFGELRKSFKNLVNKE